MYTFNEAWIVFCIATVIIIVLCLNFLDYKAKRNRQYKSLEHEFKEYKESMAIYCESQTRAIDYWKGVFESAKKRVKELESDLAKEEKVADIFEGVIQWFVQSVEENKTSKAITYIKCLKAIEESRKIDSQNQKPDDSASTAKPGLISPNEAPGKPL